ncbi:MAG: FAD-dependent oxidoreductase [Methyloceanibacter sp.]|jgi:glycine oxidase|nr:FAD-dependent oxidoreductase [Methyloceanibacter sp.]
MARRSYAIGVRGAGVVGLWQALVLARRGHAVTLYEQSAQPFAESCSVYAGAMLALRCEEDNAEPVINELGKRGIALWRETYPGTAVNGTIAVALGRDRAELDRFARMTGGHRRLSAAELVALEPGLGDRFAGALFFAEEAHLAPEPALRFVLDRAQAEGVRLRLGASEAPEGADLVIDCRGLGAKDDLPNLRGVRGERIVVKSRDVTLTRPVRLLHPRFPLYVVPWSDGLYMIGATVIESEETGAITLRSALDLLSAAYAVDPAFAEAEIVRQGAGARPAFPDNRPRIIARNGYIYVNGLYRNGFLLAPALAELVADYVETGAKDPEVFVEDPAQR